MQAIQTKWLAATNRKPSRIKAFCSAGSVTVGADSVTTKMFASHDERAHRLVAQELAAKLGWTAPIIGGDINDGAGFVFVFIPEQILNKLEKENFEIKQILADYYK